MVAMNLKRFCIGNNETNSIFKDVIEASKNSFIGACHLRSEEVIIEVLE